LDAFRPDDGLLSAIREAGTSQHHLWLGSMCIGAQLGAASSYSVFEVIGVKDRQALLMGAFFYQLHHLYYDCNYGNG